MTDNLTPNVLTVAPDGTIGADFTGHVHAQGVDLNEVPITAFAPSSAIDWLDATQVVQSYVQGALEGIWHSLVLGATGRVSARVGPIAAPIAEKVVIDNTLASSFAQLGGQSQSETGFDTLTWPGGSPISSPLVVTLPGAGGTVRGIALTTQVGASFVAIRRDLIGGGAIRFAGRTVDGSSPAAGSTAIFDYFIWGD
jgi:hypothetical protein